MCNGVKQGSHCKSNCYVQSTVSQSGIAQNSHTHCKTIQHVYMIRKNIKYMIVRSKLCTNWFDPLATMYAKLHLLVSFQTTRVGETLLCNYMKKLFTITRITRGCGFYGRQKYFQMSLQKETLVFCRIWKANLHRKSFVIFAATN